MTEHACMDHYACTPERKHAVDDLVRAVADYRDARHALNDDPGDAWISLALLKRDRMFEALKRVEEQP